MVASPIPTESGANIVEVAVFAPLRQLFQYRVDLVALDHGPQAGVRVEVPFGRSRRIGVITRVGGEQNSNGHSLKSIIAVLDPQPLLDLRDMKLAKWAADYYHHPLGEVIAGMLPSILRRGKLPKQNPQYVYQLSVSLDEALASAKGKRQQQLLVAIPCRVLGSKADY